MDLCLTLLNCHQLTNGFKILFVLITLEALDCSPTNRDEGFPQNRAIGGESLDASNFVLFIDESGMRFIDIPYQYMKNWIQDQKMWRTWTIMLTILCFVFLAVLAAFLIHNYRTSTGPFALCLRPENGSRSEDKITSLNTSDYTQPGHTSMLNTMNDPRYLPLMKNDLQL